MESEIDYKKLQELKNTHANLLKSKDIEMQNLTTAKGSKSTTKGGKSKGKKGGAKEFSISLTKLQSLFKPDNIRDGKSTSMLSKLGGISEVCQKMCTDVKKGFSTQKQSQMQKRADLYGRNDPIVTERKTIWALIIENFEDLMLRILTAAAFVSLIVGIIKEGIATGWMEGLTIIIAIVLIVSVTATNNYLKEKQFEKLNQKFEQRNVKVIRNGKNKFISVFDLLVGDLMCVQIGEIFPVDGILINGNDCNVDESSQTGESDIVKKVPAILLEKNPNLKTKESPFLISGSRLVEGQGVMVVCAVGRNTQLGIIRESLQVEKQPTPLQEKLENVANDIGLVGLYAAVAVIAILVIHICIGAFTGKFELFGLHSLKLLINAFIIGVAIIVVAVPEGLPLAVTIALAYSVGKMKDENNLVRHLAACEIMGGANNICSDKTGTLTENRMKVNQLFIEGGIKSEKQISKKEITPNVIKLFCESICMNSTADIKEVKVNNQVKINKKDGNEVSYEQIGNKTECALLEICQKLGYHYEDFRKPEQIVKVIPFSSDRKRMTTIFKLEDGSYRVAMKGAAEIVLKRCKKIISNSGETNKLEDEQQNDIQVKIIEKFAKSTLRTISIAFKDLKPNENIETMSNDDLEVNMTLIAIAGIKDHLRKGVKEAVAKCKTAGITVRMVTGDNILTAEAIAKECGILSKDKGIQGQEKGGKEQFYVMEGQRFRELVGEIVYDDPVKRSGPKIQNFKQFEKIEKQLRVLARSTPIDKLTLVTGLIQMSQIVAVTGDGSNDAPALKNADIGFAMGIEGTEIAKEAAGIILLDDNFSSIITACKWGRNIYDSIRKFIQFQLTVNLVALTMAVMGATVMKESPLNSIQMLWVNLIMDTFASLALATEPPNDDLLKRQPYKRSDSIVSPTMWKTIIMQAVYQITVLVVVLFLGPTLFNVPSSVDNDPFEIEKGYHFTLFFQIFVSMQIFNEINCRKLKNEEKNVFEGFFNNTLFIFIVVTTIIVQYLLVTFGKGFIRCSPLTLQQNGICLIIGFGSIIWGYCIKFIPDAPFSSINFFSGTSEDEEEDEEKGQPQRQESGRDKEKSLTSTLRSSFSKRISRQNSYISQTSIREKFQKK